jgi:predicted LPLAT superfamily acyltransferase
MPEVGTAWALRFGGWFHRTFGRWPSLVLVALSAGYFLLRNGPARRASRRYLARVAKTPGGRAVLGENPGWGATMRHFYQITACTYDRMVVWCGAIDTMQLEHDGSGRIFELAKTGRGALLLGAHIGNLDLLGFVARDNALRLNIVAHYDNAARVNAFFETLGADQLHLIQTGSDSVPAILEIRACVERGEIVVMLADRLPPAGRARCARVDFLGDTAEFPLAPFLLAGALGCPVHFAACVRTADAHYTAMLRPISGGERAPRAEREQRARELLTRYVAQLEDVCERHPLQWFNFFDFWHEEAG